MDSSASGNSDLNERGRHGERTIVADPVAASATLLVIRSKNSSWL